MLRKGLQASAEGAPLLLLPQHRTTFRSRSLPCWALPVPFRGHPQTHSNQRRHDLHPGRPDLPDQCRHNTWLAAMMACFHHSFRAIKTGHGRDKSVASTPRTMVALQRLEAPRILSAFRRPARTPQGLSVSRREHRTRPAGMRARSRAEAIPRHCSKASKSMIEAASQQAPYNPAAHRALMLLPWFRPRQLTLSARHERFAYNFEISSWFVIT
jgi:hypothetical protein